MSKATKTTPEDATATTPEQPPAAPVDTETPAEAEQPTDEPDAEAVAAIWSVLGDGRPHFLRELRAAAPALTADLIKRLMSTYREERRVQFVYDERAARRTGGRGERKYRATRW
jgi:hypothetical protein